MCSCDCFILCLIILQSYCYQDGMALAQKQKYRSMKQDKGPRDQAPLFMRFSRQEDWSGLPCPSPGYLPNPGMKSLSLTSPLSARGFFTTSTTWEAPFSNLYTYGLFIAQSFSHVQLFVTPWTSAHLSSLSFTISWSLVELMSTEVDDKRDENTQWEKTACSISGAGKTGQLHVKE